MIGGWEVLGAGVVLTLCVAPWVYVHCEIPYPFVGREVATVGQASLMDLIQGQATYTSRSLVEGGSLPNATTLGKERWHYVAIPLLSVGILAVGGKWLITGRARRGEVLAVSISAALATLLTVSVLSVDVPESQLRHFVGRWESARGLSVRTEALRVRRSVVVVSIVCLQASMCAGGIAAVRRWRQSMDKRYAAVHRCLQEAGVLPRHGLCKRTAMAYVAASSGLLLAAVGWLAIPLYSSGGWLAVTPRWNPPGVVLGVVCSILGTMDLFLPGLRYRVAWSLCALSYPIGQFVWKPGTLW
jgi:hypothetical protein